MRNVKYTLSENLALVNDIHRYLWKQSQIWHPEQIWLFSTEIWNFTKKFIGI